jgi:hypothetical protein
MSWVRLSEGRKALEFGLLLVLKAGFSKPKNRRAMGFERSPALWREQDSEGENPKNAWA